MVGAALLATQVKIILVRPSHSGNIGAAARAMKTMGLKDLALVNPSQFPDQQAIARAAGADDLLQAANCYTSLDAAIADCHYVYACSARQRHLSWPVCEPDVASEQVVLRFNKNPKDKIAILFGHEQSGLTNAELSVCHAQIIIPSVAEYSSLNLAAAVQVICYALRTAELQYHKSNTTPEMKNFAAVTACMDDDVPATMQQLQGLYQQLEQQMYAVGFLDRRQPKLLMQRIKRFFQLRPVGAKEVNIFRGFLSNVARSLDKKNTPAD